ncbi:hypothetical protein [Streptomyces sp. NPDC048269]|uniref:hypothetical protein n=1 Tax=Streptomyces sp. NPDC048269 TaxID=3155753 RepID=UPI003420AB5B
MREAAGPWAAPASTDAKRVWGPWAEGLDVPRDLDLGNRPRALEQLRVQPAAHSQMLAMVREVLPEREAGLLIGSRQWPCSPPACSRAGSATAPAPSPNT